MTGGCSDGLKATDIDELERQFYSHGLFTWLGFEIEAIEPGRVVFSVPFDEAISNIVSGTLHGGITATVIDTASGFALRSTFDDPGSAQLTTTDLNVRYIRPARDDIRVEATVTRAGRSMGFTESEVTTVHEGDEKIIATGGASYRLFRDPNQ